MLEIKPIQSKDEQASACARCAVSYDPDCMAYAATLDGEFLGVAQFTIEKNHGHIKNVTLLPGVEDFEAVFLMGRAMLNFIDLCGIHTATCASDAASETIIKAIGFQKNEDGVFWADMTDMFGGCGGKREE
ncbi:MAG: hypothetical protein IJ009_08050 [Clostridia bacterium]|nr:hypothetical protein [Clostridia bacterium]